VPFSPKARILLATLACILAIVVGTATPPPAQGATRAEIRLFHAMNHARRHHGLARLRFRSTLQTGAHTWARYLLLHDAFYHGRVSTGTSENIGWLTCRSGWARTLVRWWLDSYDHRVHLLDRSARRVGVGLALGRWSGYRCVRMAVTRFR
jgi:uncharacterized protein YkwD